MANCENLDLADEPNFSTLLKSVAELQSLGSDIGIERQAIPPSIFQEEHDKSINPDNEQETLQIIKQTTDIARHAMNLIIRGIQLYALCASRKSKCFNSFSSAISCIREQHGSCQPPKHLLLEWERNVMLIDLFTNDEGLYCNRRIAQYMFDICMETFDWLRSIVNNNK
ncbi:unnamed protein product [Rotaria sp. Silwood2]|nr:unnamed protein product [Rotaria sp. Silwood2]CAF2707674.1 unnamed protein product [Rotaria sp. Silwood2]CAF2973116.1 unnamed protein product [Rotaria sp. Silwood2]CAF3136186.1 unnamed protein product [Rotaria sp. Silwood2]CAF4053663.1 unnamed protein product [Rotaria sp. Silwood2]